MGLQKSHFKSSQSHVGQRVAGEIIPVTIGNNDVDVFVCKRSEVVHTLGGARKRKR
jgi:hypothetical protein